MIKLAALALLLSACVAYAKLGNTLEQTTAQFGSPAESKADYAVFLVDRYQRVIEIYNDKRIAVAVSISTLTKLSLQKRVGSFSMRTFQG